MIANANLPTMLAGTKALSTYNANDLFGVGSGLVGLRGFGDSRKESYQEMANLANAIANERIQMSSRRVVQVFIADPNENIPLEDCLLFKGEEKLTDATDQELFFELDIKSLLADHNIKRLKVIDKKVKDRIEYLEPAKVRDLKMVVITVANL